jgi:hypothetical protein
MEPFFPDWGITYHKDLILKLKSQDDAEDKENNTDLSYLFSLAKQHAKREMIKREAVNTLPKPYEIDEKLIAKEVAECILKYVTIKN